MDSDIAQVLERIEGKIDTQLERQHAHDLRFVPLEADLGRRQARAKNWARVFYSVIGVVAAATLLVMFGIRR